MRESLQLFLPLSYLLLPSSGYCSTIMLTEFAALTYPSAQAKKDEQLETIHLLNIVSSSQAYRNSGMFLIYMLHCIKYVFEKGEFLKENFSQLTGDMDKQNYSSAMTRHLCFCHVCTWKGIFKIFLYHFVTQMFASGIYSVFHKVQECKEICVPYFMKGK